MGRHWARAAGLRPIAAAQSAFIMSGGLNSVELACDAAEESCKSAVDSDPLSFGWDGAISKPQYTCTCTYTTGAD